MLLTKIVSISTQHYLEPLLLLLLLLSVELPYSNKCYVTVLGTSITKRKY